MRVSAVLVAGLLLASTAGCGKGSPPPQQHAPSQTPTATKMSAAPVPPDTKIGALFLGAGDLHTCTAGVLDSKGGDLVVTAAHCVAQDVDTTFVAGFSDTADPADVWRVDAIYLDPRWVQNQDPLADFAILRVARDSGGTVEAQAGGGLTIGPAPKSGTEVTVIGYGLGVGGGPVGCTTATELAPGGFPSLPCGGLVDGTSGAPWTTGTTAPTIIGLVGGLDGGGCDENISYSPPFDDAVVALLARAEVGGPADAAPAVFDDDC
jgi:hypothetical protein